LKNKLILICLLLLPILAISQATDTTAIADDIYKGDVTAAPDSLIKKGNQLINDAEQADKILNESITIGMLDSLNAIPYFQDYYFNTDTALLNIYNFPMAMCLYTPIRFTGTA